MKAYVVYEYIPYEGEFSRSYFLSKKAADDFKDSWTESAKLTAFSGEICMDEITFEDALEVSNAVV